MKGGREMHACMHAYMHSKERSENLPSLSLFVSAENGVKGDCQDDSRDGAKREEGRRRREGSQSSLVV